MANQVTQKGYLSYPNQYFYFPKLQGDNKCNEELLVLTFTRLWISHFFLALFPVFPERFLVQAFSKVISLYNTPERSLGSSATSSWLEITTICNTPESTAQGKGAKARLSPDLPKGGEVAAHETTGLKNKLPA